MKRLSFGARGLKNREETAKENENGDIGEGTCALMLTLHYIGKGSGEPPPFSPDRPRWKFVHRLDKYS